jgi:hypothetical protein
MENTVQAEPSAPLTVAEAAAAWEIAKMKLGEASRSLWDAAAERDKAAIAERAARKAFDAAMRPKSPRKPKDILA